VVAKRTRKNPMSVHIMTREEHRARAVLKRATGHILFRDLEEHHRETLMDLQEALIEMIMSFHEELEKRNDKVDEAEATITQLEEAIEDAAVLIGRNYIP
jgi:hypothetical protein